jgi:glucose/mannose transport system permease protein
VQINNNVNSYVQLEKKSKITNMLLRWFLYFVLILFASYFIFPLYVMIVTSLKTMEEIRQGTLLTFPSGLNFDSWAVAWEGRGYGAGDTFFKTLFLEFN